MMWCIALTFIWYFRLSNANGDNCLLCEEVARPEFCGTVKRCGSHEKCFIDTTVSAAGIIRYKLGCRDVLQCTHTNSTRISNTRRSAINLICSECCVGDLCNSAGCGNSGYPIRRGPICFNCPQQTSEEDCSKIQMCHQSQVCMLHKKLDPVTDIWIYESKCESAQECNYEIARYKKLESVIIGKRQEREYFLNQQGSCLVQCCKTALCNNNCNLFPHTTTTSLRTPSKPHTQGSSSVMSTLMPFDACLSNPCQRGTCSPYRNTYKCTCEYGIYGRNCELVAIPGTTPAKTTSVPHVATTSTVSTAGTTPAKTASVPNVATTSKGFAHDCYDVLHTGMGRKNGVYRVNLWKSKKEVDIYCDLETSGGGWTVFQQRYDGSVDFYRNFKNYTQGFGSLYGEFWLGLENIHEMVSRGSSELRIDLMAADGSTAYELHEFFYLFPGPTYILRTGLGNGTAGDSGFGLSFNSDLKFYTYDHDNWYDCASAQKGHGGWWYNECTWVNLNGQYVTPGTKSQTHVQGGMIYYQFQQWKSLKRSKIMFRLTHN